MQTSDNEEVTFGGESQVSVSGDRWGFEVLRLYALN